MRDRHTAVSDPRVTPRPARVAGPRRTGTQRVPVPQELCGLVTADAGEAAAETAGLAARDVARLWQAVEELYRSGAYPAVMFCLRHQGRVVLNRAIGHAQGNGPGDAPDTHKRLATPHQPVALFSASKAITATLVHMLAEGGGIELDRPVAHYLPAFAANGKQRITVADVLAHRGGIPNFVVDPTQRRVELLADWDRCVELLCAAQPVSAGRPAYHALTGGYILGELIQRVTGRPLREYLDTRLRQPLGMRHFTYGLPREHRTQAARNYIAGAPVRFPISTLMQRELMVPFEHIVEFSNTDLGMDAVVPAGNMFATAEELSRFYQMLLDGGVYEGRRVLQPRTLQRLLQPVGRMRIDGTLRVPMRYSEGLMLGANPYGLYGPMCASAYGHIGFMNIYGWADPARHLSCSLLVTGKAVLGSHLFSLATLLNTINRVCAPADGLRLARSLPRSLIEFTA